MTPYEALGGSTTFERLVDRFYDAITADPILRPMYPEDLDSSRRHLALFLIQYFGGPTTYLKTRGQPRLRARHFPFAIDRAARDAWMAHMTAAVRSGDFAPEVQAELLRYFKGAADFLINRE